MKKYWKSQVPAGWGRFMILLVIILAVFPENALAQVSQTPPDLDGIQLTLQKALDLALEFNPSLKGYTAAENEALAWADQAGRGLNPELGLEVEDFLGSGPYNGFSSAQYTLFLAQTFQLGGKPAKKREAASWNAEIIRLEARLRAIDLRAAVTQVFIEILAARQEIALTEELVGLAEQDLEYIRRRVANGSLSPVEVNRAEVSLFSATMALNSAQQTLGTKRIQLATMWNTTEPTFGEISGSLDLVAPLRNWEDLAVQLDQSPRLDLFALEAEKRQAELALARVQGKIDLTASAGIRHYRDSGDNAAVASISIPLPVRNRNKDAIRAGQFGLEQVGALRQAQVVTLRADLANQHEQLSRTFLQATSIRQEILPASEKALTSANEAYRKGLFTQTDVISVRRAWFELNSLYYQALAGYQSAIVEIDRILGTHLSLSLTTLENE